jgi:hypothetical protein
MQQQVLELSNGILHQQADLLLQAEILMLLTYQQQLLTMLEPIVVVVYLQAEQQLLQH